MKVEDVMRKPAAFCAHDANLAAAARAICERHNGIGADGWLLVSQPPPGERTYDSAIELFNSDGSTAELSGNGTRCAAARSLARQPHECGEALRENGGPCFPD